HRSCEHMIGPFKGPLVEDPARRKYPSALPLPPRVREHAALAAREIQGVYTNLLAGLLAPHEMPWREHAGHLAPLGSGFCDLEFEGTGLPRTTRADDELDHLGRAGTGTFERGSELSVECC